MVRLTKCERAACRPLLRLARLAERQPARISTLLGQPPRLYNNKSGKVQQVSGDAGQGGILNFRWRLVAKRVDFNGFQWISSDFI